MTLPRETQRETEGPCRELAQALTAVIQQAVEKAVTEAVAEILSQLTAPADQVLVMDVPDAAARIGLSVSKTKRLIAAGEIDSVLIGRRRKVPGAAVDAYVRRLEGEQLTFPGM
jgi:excisionase family DNA binding protein